MGYKILSRTFILICEILPNQKVVPLLLSSLKGAICNFLLLLRSQN